MRKTARPLILLLLVMMLSGCGYTHKLAEGEAVSAFGSVNWPAAPDTITASDLDTLPPPVQRYLKKAGVLGKERVHTFAGQFSGKMKMGGEKAKWLPVEVIQHSVIDTTLTRIFYIRTRMFGIIPVVGRDKYENGKGNMLIRVADLFTVVNQSGVLMDRSELVTFLNDMAMFPMAMLGKKVAWEAVNDTAAKAVLSDCGLQVSALFIFDNNDDLVNFVTDDRTYDDGRGDVRKARWWTPLRKFREYKGVRIFSEGDAVWDFGDKRFTYAHFTIEDVEFNARVPIKR